MTCLQFCSLRTEAIPGTPQVLSNTMYLSLVMARKGKRERDCRLILKPIILFSGVWEKVGGGLPTTTADPGKMKTNWAILSKKYKHFAHITTVVVMAISWNWRYYCDNILPFLRVERNRLPCQVSRLCYMIAIQELWQMDQGEQKWWENHKVLKSVWTATETSITLCFQPTGLFAWENLWRLWLQVYAGLYQPGTKSDCGTVYRSTDGGTTWSDTVFPACTPYRAALGSDGTLYVTFQNNPSSKGSATGVAKYSSGK